MQWLIQYIQVLPSLVLATLEQPSTKIIYGAFDRINQLS